MILTLLWIILVGLLPHFLFRKNTQFKKLSDEKLGRLENFARPYYQGIFYISKYFRLFTPNQLSALSLFVALFYFYSIIKGYWGLGIWLLTLSGLFDLLDGMIARKNNTTSKWGAVLDSTLDRVCDLLFLAPFLYIQHDRSINITIILMAISGSFLISYLSAKGEIYQIKLPRGMMKRLERFLLLIFGLLISTLFKTAVPVWLALGFIALGSWISSFLRARVLYQKLQ